MMSKKPYYYTMRQVCRMTTLSEKTIRNMIKNHDFPPLMKLPCKRRKVFLGPQIDLWMLNPLAWKEANRPKPREQLPPKPPEQRLPKPPRPNGPPPTA